MKAIGPVGTYTEGGYRILAPEVVTHHEFTAKADNGAHVTYQNRGAEMLVAHGDSISKSVAEHEFLSFSDPENSDYKAGAIEPFGRYNPVGSKVLVRAKDGRLKSVNVHTYRLSDIRDNLEDVFRRHQVSDLLQKLATAKAVRRQPKRISVENTSRGKQYKFIAHHHDVEFELRRGTPWAASESGLKRTCGQMLQRVRELGKGINSSLRNAEETGQSGGRVLFTSVPTNVFVLLLVASLGLYELHKNDLREQRYLQQNPPP